MPTVTYNGTRIDTNWWITGISRPKPEYAVSAEDLLGADGHFYRGSSLNAAAVSLSLAPKVGKDVAGLFDALMKLLNVKEPKKLVFGDEGGRYRLAVPQGLPSMEEWHDYATISVEFFCPDPALYGDAQSAVVGTSNAQFTVGGSYPARVAVASADATKSASGLWGVRFDNGKYMRVPLSADSAVAVSIDSDARTARANGAACMITLDSDWIELSPGNHVARIDQGGGNATVTWKERWL